MRRVRALLSSSLIALAVLAGTACNLGNLGDPPPAADIYLPTGVLLSQQSETSAPRFLYLINSNFDLRYNRGSVQAFDLDRLAAAVDSCATPGVDCQLDPVPILTDEVLVPSLATSFAISPDRRRLYVATRTDPSMMFIDLDEQADGEDVLKCDEVDRRCSDDRQRGASAAGSPRGFVFPPEPVGMVTLPVGVASGAPPSSSSTPADNFVMVAHRSGQVSLFYDNGTGDGPTLLHVLAGLPLEPTDLAFDPGSGLAYLSVYARTSTVSGLARILLRVGLTQPAGQEIDASFLYDAGAVVIDGVAAQRDTRAVALNPWQPGQLLVAARDPASILYVDVGSTRAQTPPTSVPTRHIAPVAAGPDRIASGQVGDLQIVAVSCFDGHAVYLLDASDSNLLGIIHYLNGPFELAIDSVRQRLYLADFRASSVQVIDLSHLASPDLDAAARTDTPILATLGFPKVVMELQ